MSHKLLTLVVESGQIKAVNAAATHHPITQSTTYLVRPVCTLPKFFCRLQFFEHYLSLYMLNIGSIMLIPTEETLNGTPSLDSEPGAYDLVCVGFGPASLAIAVALHDREIKPRVLYLERQRKFTWHGGMLLPEARMQISFLKDLATLRNPRSHFTFLNYLKSKNRLVAFTNLSTFLPLREEYNDYLGWCASHFNSSVRYGHETLDITPHAGQGGRIDSWDILSRDILKNETSAVRARHVVIAVGGKPKIPASLSDSSPNSPIVHSSSYSHAALRMLADKRNKGHVAVVGGGQSAAEIFNDLQNRFDNIQVSLFTGDSALRPSDDSPL